MVGSPEDSGRKVKGLSSQGTFSYLPAMETDAILRHIAQHITLEPEEEAFFTSLLRARTLRKKELLLQQGAICPAEYFIVSGCVRVFTTDADGVDHITFFGTENWWVGDLFSFLSQKPALHSIEALEPTELLCLTKADLEHLYVRVPKFERFFRILLQNAFIAQQQRINQTLSLSAEERYLQFRQRFPQLEQRIPQKQLAAYLGVTPVFLSMMRRRWAKPIS